MSKYLATDLDGTLLHPKLEDAFVCKENKEVVNLFNGNVFIISGRSQQFIKEVCDELNLAYTFIACNGAIIYANGKKIYTKHIDNEIVLSLIDYVKNNHTNYHIIFIDEDGDLYSIFDNEKEVIDKENKILNSYPKLAYVTDKNPTHLYKLLENENKIVKINIYLDETQKYQMLDSLNSKQFDIGVSVCNNSLEITAKNINKGISLKRLTDSLNIDDNDVYVIGDDGNDVTMFNHYKNSFLVKNKDNKHLRNKAKHDLKTFEELKKYMED